LLESPQAHCLAGYGVTLLLSSIFYARHSKSVTQIGRHELQNPSLLWFVVDYLYACLYLTYVRFFFLLPARSIMETHLQDKSALISSRVNERTVVCCRKLCPRTLIPNILFYFILGMNYKSKR